jgi:hypothetical protein
VDTSDGEGFFGMVVCSSSHFEGEGVSLGDLGVFLEDVACYSDAQVSVYHISSRDSYVALTMMLRSYHGTRFRFLPPSGTNVRHVLLDARPSGPVSYADVYIQLQGASREALRSTGVIARDVSREHGLSCLPCPHFALSHLLACTRRSQTMSIDALLSA